MLDIAKLYFFIFGILTIVGGVMGFVKAKSRASLIAGSISGILLAVAGHLIGIGNTLVGLIIGLVLSLALAGQFGPKFFRGGKFMPAGLIAILSAIGIVVAILGFVLK